MSSQGYREKCLSEKSRECVACGSTEDVVVHHKNGDRRDNSIENLVPMCEDCHTAVHSEYEIDNPTIEHLRDLLPGEPEFREHDSKARTTIKVDRRGRAVIPSAARKALGIENKISYLDVEMECLKIEDRQDED
jgi:hypothetical protein